MSNQEEKNPELDLAFRYLQDTSENVFLTGKAGTGKTTFLHNLRKSSPKRMVVLAPTGVAAINAGGVTIHSFFQMPFGPWIPGGQGEPASDGQFRKGLFAKYHRFSREKLNIIKSVDLLVIDEISMVRADLLDGIDEILRRFRDRSKPFGGVQILMIGDLQQLAPVVKDDEWEIIRKYYDTPFFFGSNALKKSNYVTIELKHVYRQSDREFIELLNKIRNGDRDPETLSLINRRYQPGINTSADGFITLTTHNFQAKRINEEKMRRLGGKSSVFKAKVEGEFPEFSYPTDLELELKVGAQVMFVKNDSSPEKRYYNGKIGKVESIDDEAVYVKCPGDDSIIVVGPLEWGNMKYGLNEAGEIVETVIGTFTQYPLKAAWAITIHKSQGLTFDKVVIDAGAAFAHGQVYVALSRCRTLEGLFLSSRLSPSVLINSSSVTEFTRNMESNCPDESQLLKSVCRFQQTLLHELFDFRPIQKQISILVKNVRENREDFLPELVDKLSDLEKVVRSEITDIAGRFSTQIEAFLRKEPCAEQNAPLQERLQKGTGYFGDKLVSVDEIIRRGDEIDVDNRDLQKSISDCIKHLREEKEKKAACLAACLKGFRVKEYLEARSKASIEKRAEKRRKEPLPQEIDTANVNQDLYRNLKLWRAGKADSLGIPAYQVIPNKTITGICASLPVTLKELKAVHGIGKMKLAQFGEEILEVVRIYREEKTDLHSDIRYEPEQEIKKEKESTRHISLNLYKSGKSINEIAAERGLTVSTIERHLAYFISTGELDISSFLSSDKVTEISEYFLKQNSRKLNPAKEYFGERVTYGELHLVLAHMDYTGGSAFTAAEPSGAAMTPIDSVQGA